jgi:SOS response regulatory protein OraA/RecX
MALTSTDGREIAVSALRRRDLSEGAIARRLRTAGASDRVVWETLAWLGRRGYVDDARLARNRAFALAEKGYGDAAIALRLAQEGIDDQLQKLAIAELEPEIERARAYARGTSLEQAGRLARALSRRGFRDDSIEAALLMLDDSANAGLP